MSATPALLVAAAGVGFGHAILPDHWVPLAVVGRTRRYPLSKVARLSGLAGVAHVLVSVLLGAVIVVVGLQLRSTVEHAQNAIVGSLLIATGLAFLVLTATHTTTGPVTHTITTTPTNPATPTSTPTASPRRTDPQATRCWGSWSRSARPPHRT